MVRPVLILWNLWLERNGRFFCESKLDSPQLWRRILSRLQETIFAKCDMAESIDPDDQVIVRNLNLDGSKQRHTFRKRHCYGKQRVCRVGRWTPPLAGTLKINTDDSSRGNPGHAGIGGIGRSNDGAVVFIFSTYKGQHSNNLMEALAIKTVVERGCSIG